MLTEVEKPQVNISGKISGREKIRWKNSSFEYFVPVRKRESIENPLIFNNKEIGTGHEESYD